MGGVRYTETVLEGVFTLVYDNQLSADEILYNYDKMLRGSKHYLRINIPDKGAIIKGTIYGHKVMILVKKEIPDQNQLGVSYKSFVKIYSYDESYISK
jgi:hypothetical protein